MMMGKYTDGLRGPERKDQCALWQEAWCRGPAEASALTPDERTPLWHLCKNCFPCWILTDVGRNQIVSGKARIFFIFLTSYKDKIKTYQIIFEFSDISLKCSFKLHFSTFIWIQFNSFSLVCNIISLLFLSKSSIIFKHWRVSQAKGEIIKSEYRFICGC